MRRLSLLVPLASASVVLAGPALAQVAYNQPGGSRYGGGFIELMMTGEAPGRDGRPAPFDPPGARRRTAALPAQPDESYLGRELSPVYQRQMVEYRGPDAPGTIVVDTPAKFLYHVQPGGQAMRYGIGVGRPGFTWAGIKSVTMKREWPGWTPPAEMLRRRPDLPRHMEGGPGNPLGARALYLGSSLYRIHGTNEPHTIGQNVSSGCIRMMNEDVQDLYDNVRVGTRVRVI